MWVLRRLVAIRKQHHFGAVFLYKEGCLISDGRTYKTKQLGVAKDSIRCTFEIEANSTIYIFGGEAFSGKQFIEWNLVASDKILIAKAKAAWKGERFLKVPKDTLRIP
ncbi:MAG: pirin-like C-terminal cupin domain-containing protein [Winogradskyella arenosi]